MAFDGDTSSALFYDAIHGRQPEPRSFAFRLGCKKRLEKVRLGFLVHPKPDIAHGYPHVVPWIQTWHLIYPSLGQSHGLCFDRQPATGRHRISRIDGEIHDDLLDL